MDAGPLDEATIAYDQCTLISGPLPSFPYLIFDRRINNYFYLAGIVLLIYDHFLTFDVEVQYVWRSARTRASAWYLFVRYSALCLPTVALLAFGNINREVRSL
ncbi:hypothetical protein K438DRAFT_489612 [Mycena galopus ATCC 62051]|nr:hypothetical protein K438DRAFT_489612 [Mycena galopus ATCC 62051]